MPTKPATMTIHATVAATVQLKDADPDLWSVTFQPDYDHDGNGAWAKHTPAMAMELNVKRDIADKLEPGAAVTITVVPA